MNILEKITQATKERVASLQKSIPLASMRQMAESTAKTFAYNELEPFAFEKALQGEDMSFICEVKKASPSKGIIAENFPYIDIALAYQEAGANAISCLSEPLFFLGSDAYLKAIKQAVKIPVLRKDFIIDEYMVYESKVMGADALLLIAAILDKEQMREYFSLATSLGLSVLVEAHNESEVKNALEIDSRIIGVNNRDLKTFQVDLHTSIYLRGLVPNDRIFVSESGIQTREDIMLLEQNNVDAVLIGEWFMRQQDKTKALQNLRGKNAN